MDDRKSKWIADQREREQREARASSASAGHGSDDTDVSNPPEKQMPGPGHVLTSDTPEEVVPDSMPPPTLTLQPRSINANLDEDDGT